VATRECGGSTAMYHLVVEHPPRQNQTPAGEVVSRDDGFAGPEAGPRPWDHLVALVEEMLRVAYATISMGNIIPPDEIRISLLIRL